MECEPTSVVQRVALRSGEELSFSDQSVAQVGMQVHTHTHTHTHTQCQVCTKCFYISGSSVRQRAVEVVTTEIVSRTYLFYL